MSREELREAADRLRATVREAWQGSARRCRVLSEGSSCTCGLCDIDRLLSAATKGGES